MVDINITFGMHAGHAFTYQVFMTDGELNLGRIFEQYTFKSMAQDFIKEGLWKFMEIRKWKKQRR